MSFGRIAAFLALVAAFVVVVALLLGGGGGHSYKLLLESGGQLVPGNQVLVGGQKFGSVDDLSLTDDGRAAVTITVEEPLTEGTTATVRSTSLSGIANRYVSVTRGPDNAPELEEGATLSDQYTTAPVDLDQLFDTLDEKTRAERRNDLSALTSNANEALGAIAAENESLDRSLVALPPAMRQADTTFINLRAARDDLDPLVETAKPATRDLAPFLRNLRPVAQRAIPVVGDLRTAIATPGPDNDLTDVLRLAPRVEQLADSASDRGIEAINDSEHNIEVLRTYSPDLMAAIAKLGQVTGYYDGNGHYARVLPAGLSTFQYNDATEELEPTYATPSSQLSFYSSTPNAFSKPGYERCPGASSQAPADASAPFLYSLDPGECDPADLVIPGAAP